MLLELYPRSPGGDGLRTRRSQTPRQSYKHTCISKEYCKQHYQCQWLINRAIGGKTHVGLMRPRHLTHRYGGAARTISSPLSSATVAHQQQSISSFHRRFYTKRSNNNRVVRMLIQESHVDVETSVNGQNGSMSAFAAIFLLNRARLTTTIGIFLFHPTVPGYPQASVMSLYLNKPYHKTGLNVPQQIPWRLPLQ